MANWVMVRTKRMNENRKFNEKFSEGDKKEEVKEKCDGQKPTNETNSEDIEVIDVETSGECGAWKKKEDQVRPTPIFHGGRKTFSC